MKKIFSNLYFFLKSKNIQKIKIVAFIYINLKNIIYIPIISVLRYYQFYNPKYNVSKKINFNNDKENDFFIKKLKECKLYLEFGSGNSTLLAKFYNKKFYSIESDKNFYFFLKKKFNLKNYFLRDIGIVKYFSIPLLFHLRKKFLLNKANKYSSDIFKILKKEKIIPDFILVDGRYRVLTAIYLYKFYKDKNKKFTIIIDDYKERNFYHIIDKFFEIKTYGRFGVTSKIKKGINPEKYIVDYVLDYR